MGGAVGASATTKVKMERVEDQCRRWHAMQQFKNAGFLSSVDKLRGGLMFRLMSWSWQCILASLHMYCVSELCGLSAPLCVVFTIEIEVVVLTLSTLYIN